MCLNCEYRYVTKLISPQLNHSRSCSQNLWVRRLWQRIFSKRVSLFLFKKRGFKIKYWSLTALVSSKLTGCRLVGCLHYFCSGPFVHFCPTDHAGILSTFGWRPNIEPLLLWRTSDSINSCGPRSLQHLGYRPIPHFEISWTHCERTSRDCCWQGCCWSWPGGLPSDWKGPRRD